MTQGRGPPRGAREASARRSRRWASSGSTASSTAASAGAAARARRTRRRRSWRWAARWNYHLLPEFGPRIADEITEIDWQRWIDELARSGLSRSTIAKHISVASDIYAWASAPSRRLVPRNPLRLVELPPNDEKPRLRVALAPEAAALLAALEPEDRLPYAIAFYAGLRRSEIDRLEWHDVLDGDAHRDAPPRPALQERGRHPAPPADRATTSEPSSPTPGSARAARATGKVVDRSVMSGKIARRVEARWDAAGLNRITLHECRHTYASLLMAAGYTIKELMEFMGHADLQMVNRYVKLLPQPGEDDAADRLNAYLKRAAADAP